MQHAGGPRSSCFRASRGLAAVLAQLNPTCRVVAGRPSALGYFTTDSGRKLTCIPRPRLPMCLLCRGSMSGQRPQRRRCRSAPAVDPAAGRQCILTLLSGCTQIAEHMPAVMPNQDSPQHPLPGAQRHGLPASTRAAPETQHPVLEHSLQAVWVSSRGLQPFC